jgi:hypothetical protein
MHLKTKTAAENTETARKSLKLAGLEASSHTHCGSKSSSEIVGRQNLVINHAHRWDA